MNFKKLIFPGRANWCVEKPGWKMGDILRYRIKGKYSCNIPVDVQSKMK